MWQGIFPDTQNLRRKIEADPAAPRYIVTVPGRGYRFEGAGRDGVGGFAKTAHSANCFSQNVTEFQDRRQEERLLQG